MRALDSSAALGMTELGRVEFGMEGPGSLGAALRIPAFNHVEPEVVELLKRLGQGFRLCLHMYEVMRYMTLPSLFTCHWAILDRLVVRPLGDWSG